MILLSNYNGMRAPKLRCQNYVALAQWAAPQPKNKRPWRVLAASHLSCGLLAQREREARTNAGSPARLPRCYQNCSQELRGLAFRGLQCCERFTCLLFHVRVKAVSMRVHGDDRGEIVDAKMPHGFRNSEFHQVHA